MDKSVQSLYQDHWKYAVFAAPLAAVGIPIYIYAPKFLIDEYGFSLSFVGFLFLILRSVDVIQDPILGKIAQMIGNYRKYSIFIFVALLCTSVWCFFAVEPVFLPWAYLGACLLVMFTAFSYLNICFYSQGITFIESRPNSTHAILAAWRETGALIGIVLACLLPTLFQYLEMDVWVSFAISIVLLLLVANIVMSSLWSYSSKRDSGVSFLSLFKDEKTRWFLFLGFLNSSPVAVTSTLFLFFVEARLQAVGFSGIFLLTFFVSAAVSVPFWGKLATIYNIRKLLSLGMLLAILTFGFTFFMSAGDIVPFFLICGLSGASLGADLSLLPAMYSSHISKAGMDSSMAFGLWGFFNKITLSISAGLILPVIAMMGFEPGKSGSDSSLLSLTVFYTLLPCLLKFLALIALNYGIFEREEN